MNNNGHFPGYAPIDIHQLWTAEDSALTLFNAGFKREAIALIEYAENAAENESHSELKDAFDYSKLRTLKEIFQKTGVVISLHQPAYLPWLGYLHKIYYSDKFAIQDDVQFTRKSFIKRTLIRKPNSNDPTYLIVPAKKHSDRCDILELEIDNSEDWRSTHLRKIHLMYAKEAFFREYFPRLENIMADTRTTSSLASMNNTLLFFLLDILHIETEIVLLSKMTNGMAFPDAHERNITMCKMLGGTTYFSGAGAKKYHDGRELPSNIKLIYQNFGGYLSKNPYLPKEKFINGLSSLDALFCIGPKRIIEIFKNYDHFQI